MDPNSREARMVVLRRSAEGVPTVWCDLEIVDLVDALNNGNLETLASCSGHGHRPGWIALADGRHLIVAKDHDEMRRIETLWPLDINGDEMPLPPPPPRPPPTRWICGCPTDQGECRHQREQRVLGRILFGMLVVLLVATVLAPLIAGAR